MQIKALCNPPSYVHIGRKDCLTKTLLVMKLTIFLLLGAMLQVSARTNAQTVTYTGKAVPLTTVFSAIKEQTGYLFFYRKEDLADAAPVTLQLRNVSLQAALEQTLEGQSLNFAIQGNTVFITLKPTPPPTPKGPLPEGSEEALPPSIRGRITDSLGTPLSGASIMIKGTKRGTTTDARGDFELKGVAENVTLVISFTSYTTKEYKVKDYANKLFVIMSRSNSPLDDVQVIAYGTNTRRFSVGSVSTVTSEEIERQPVTNVLLALQGRVPGLTVDLSNGIPGSSVHTQVRGQNNIQNISGKGQASDEPLYILDGVPLALQNQNLSYTISSFAGNNTYAPSGLSPLNVLNPSDIESISVLKDADATSIYGSQGANGVIVITTKKGRPGATSLNIRVNTGPNKIGRNLPMLNTQQYLAMRHQAIKNDSLPALDPTDSYTFGLFPDLLAFDSTKYTNWSKKFFSGTSNNTDAHVSLSGGSQYTTFIASTGYTKSVYNFPGNFSDERMTLHSGFHHSSLDRRLTIDLGTDFSYDRNNSSASPSLGQALVLAPNLPDMIDPSGKLVWNYNGADISSYQMMAYLKQPFSLQTYALNSSLNVTYQVLTGLTFRIGMGYSYLTTKEYSADPLSTQGPPPPFYPAPQASAKFVRSDGQTINIEPQIDYRRTIGRGVLTALVGGTYKKRTTSYNEIDASGFSDDALLGSPSAATTFSIYDGAYLNKYDGVFGRLGYIYDKEFIVNLTGRRDGSSNFGPGRQFGNFGSVGLGWIFSELNAFKTGLPIISYGKISGNYGTNGSEGVAPYLYQPFWKPGNSYSYPLFQGTRPLLPQNLYNPNYSWASKHAINLALDLGFAHDRVLMNITWYRNRTGNQLTSYNLPSQTGFRNVVENFNANLQDAGLELTISTMNIKTKNFRWTTSFNISGNRNKLISFPGLATSSYAGSYQVGKSTSMISAIRSAGLNDTTGVFQFYTGKGDRTYKPNYLTNAQGGDMAIIGNSDPKFFGGLGNTFTYKGWSLSVFFQFSKRFTQNYLAGVYGGFMPGGMSNLPVELNGMFWEKSGDKATLQRLTTGSYQANKYGALAQNAGRYFSSSDGVYSDDSYLRLKNLSLSYSIPAAYLKKVGMKGANIYVNAQNLLTFTNYKFGDPEMPGALYIIPVQRIIAGGVSLDF
jgi:TonB-linked SusC/RagA family outer membrane protein